MQTLTLKSYKFVHNIISLLLRMCRTEFSSVLVLWKNELLKIHKVWVQFMAHIRNNNWKTKMWIAEEMSTFDSIYF
ncbi:hypothetical protein Y032_0008g134 [Ancylostoma ceylanicum]|uniref:Uncharacterized protein n=1 Tax=Ancylostoma ceylanicum TaxID=53326 RepID=A0A016VL02_9BILA|nr:hypothetical protein Y032_0008g134 [Ancylostoma ceylanicum]